MVVSPTLSAAAWTIFCPGLALPAHGLGKQCRYGRKTRSAYILGEGMGLEERPEALCIHRPEELPEFGKVVIQHRLQDMLRAYVLAQSPFAHMSQGP